MQRQALLNYLDELLSVANYRDYCPNGLQVEGKANVTHIVTAVTASQAAIEQAIALGADTLLVHHGYFWKGEDERVIGIKQKRLKALLAHEINLIAYHLPLDSHPIYGNNVQLAKLMGWLINGPLVATDASIPGLQGRLPVTMSSRELGNLITAKLGRAPLCIGDENQPITRIAWCTGAAQSYLQLAVNSGVDAFITGEINEPSVHLARETGTVFFSAGHHATERYGIKALGEHLAQHQGLKVDFIDIDNPV